MNILLFIGKHVFRWMIILVITQWLIELVDPIRKTAEKMGNAGAIGMGIFVAIYCIISAIDEYNERSDLHG